MIWETVPHIICLNYSIGMLTSRGYLHPTQS